ncbi:hypothetical protein [Streptomyces sp. NPDC006307]|uniref:hypothetical protein n=1 Tax=Streptomyces sp. NPDC006307 TaxID=3156748 RepID=UPI0033AB9232
MTYTSDLVFLGPAIGAVITSVYALRAARHSTAMQLHTSYADKRLDIVNGLLDATEECRRAGTVQERREAGRKLHPAVLRVRLAFNSDHGLIKAADATVRWARLVMEHPRPAQPRDLVALAALRKRALYDGPESPAQAALSFVSSVRRDQEEAAAKGLPQPDVEKYEQEAFHWEMELGDIDVAHAIPAWGVRQSHSKAVKDHEHAQVELTTAQVLLVDAANRHMLSPTHLDPPAGLRRLRARRRLGPAKAVIEP